MDGRVVSSGMVRGDITTHHTTRHNILSTAPQLSISQKALGTLPEDDNVMPKHVGATIHNKLNKKLVHLLVFTHIFSLLCFVPKTWFV
jgi:hypothetical protein